MVRWVWDQIESWMGWLVGWLVVFYTSSFPFDREEGIEGCIYSSSYYQEKTPRRECSTSVRYRPYRNVVGMYSTRQTKQNKILKRSGMVPCIRS